MEKSGTGSSFNLSENDLVGVESFFCDDVDTIRNEFRHCFSAASRLHRSNASAILYLSGPRQSSLFHKMRWENTNGWVKTMYETIWMAVVKNPRSSNILTSAFVWLFICVELCMCVIERVCVKWRSVTIDETTTTTIWFCAIGGLFLKFNLAVTKSKSPWIESHRNVCGNNQAEEGIAFIRFR